MTARWMLSVAIIFASLLVLAGVAGAQGPQPDALTQVTLPYEGTTNTTGTAFAILNTGTGISAVGVAGRTDNGFAGVVGYSANRHGVFGLSVAASDAGVYGRNDGAGIGVWGRSAAGIGVSASSTNNFALRADSTNSRAIMATTGSLNNAAIWGEHTGANVGFGVVGVTQNGQAVRAQSYNGPGVLAVGGNYHGIEAVTSADNQAGVWGRKDGAVGGAGVRGTSDKGYGVDGVSVDNTGVNGSSTNGVGVQARSVNEIALVVESTNEDSIEAISTKEGKSAIYAHHDGDKEGNGVYASTQRGYAIQGLSRRGTGIYAEGDRDGDGLEATTDGNGAAVYAYREDRGQLAGAFDGKVSVNGTLEKAAGSFKIDHPLDPANKYLSHSFVESPDMMNVYNGNVTTDKNGDAIVKLPDYFEALNRDFRYQLTVIGQFAQAIVAEEIKDNKFVIKTDKPNVKVSWQVTGIRHDPYATANPIVVEQEKPSQERGSYLVPEVYGEPKSKSVSRVYRPQLDQSKAR